MKKFLRGAMLPLVLILFILLAACPNTGTTVTEVNNEAVVGSVWAGQTPAANNTGWLTITFRTKAAGNSYESGMGVNVAVLSYAHDNTSAVWDYSYYTNHTGEAFTNGKSAWTGADTTWNPGAYTISADGNTLTFSSFMGGPMDFKKVRGTNLTVVSPVPFTPEILADNLVGSVWAGSTPAAGNTGWVTITFRAKATSGSAGTNEAGMEENVAVISYAHDNTTAVWNYSYDSSTRAGTAFTNGLTPAGASQSWNPGAYTINEAGDAITFSSFMGAEHSFKRYR
jgi:hypothetical protein